MKPTLNPPDPIGRTVVMQHEGTFAAAKLVTCSSPVHLRAAAHLYGVRSVPLSNARVLELGCAKGENLLPFALAYPGAHVVGVDRSEVCIEAGQQRAQAANARNLRLCVADLTLIGADFGEFDYIIAHGIYGRAPAEISQAVLRICRQNLSALGIAYVSYNTYPGWKANDVLRDAMLLHARSATSDAELIGSMRAAAKLLFENGSPDNFLQMALKKEAEQAGDRSDEELASDYLMGSGSACYFAEFADAAQQMHLVHMGDAQPQNEMASQYGTQVSLNHTLIALGQPRLMRQQYLDFMVGRKFRASMLVHQEREAEVLADPDMKRLADLRVAGSFVRRDKKRGGPNGTFVYDSSLGRQIETSDAAATAVMNALSHAWPASLTVSELIKYIMSTPYGMDATAHEDAIFGAVRMLFTRRVLRCSLGPGPYDALPGEDFALLPGLAGTAAPIDGQEEPAWQIHGFNLWHEPLAMRLDAVGASLLPRLDGNDPTQMPRHLVSGLVDQLRRQGAIRASPAAWQAYYRQSLDAACDEPGDWLPYVDVLIGAARACGEAVSGGRDAPVLEPFEKLFERGSYDDAVSSARQLTRHAPHSADAWRALGRALLMVGQYAESIAALAKALARGPLDVRTHIALGTALYRSGAAGESEAAYCRALILDPDEPDGYAAMGELLWSSRRRVEAEFFFHRALALRPDSAAALASMANALTAKGKLAEAIGYHRKALGINPDLLSAHSNLVFLLSHYDGIPAKALFDAHRSYGLNVENRAASVSVLPRFSTPKPGAKLRLGFVSSDLYDHVVVNFLEPIWRALDRDAFEIHVYSTGVVEDAATARLKSAGDVWHKVFAMTDLDLANNIRKDGIDILFDLMGHTGESRLSMFALKPAPIQVSWLGYPATTGLASMDYFLIDRHVAAPGYLDAQFTEKLVYLPAWGVFEPYADSPAVGPLPALRNGHLTFGSFNRASKIGDATMDIWGSVLRAVPSARMLLGNVEGDEGRQDLINRFGKQRVALDRLVFRSRSSIAQYLGFHQEVDILLDTYPYTGGTITCHALWMGVPVLTLRGQTRPSRLASGVLAAVGLDQWIADTKRDLVAKAAGWTSRLDALSEIRAGARSRFMKSSFYSADRVTRALESALKQMWQRRCDGLPPASFTAGGGEK